MGSPLTQRAQGIQDQRWQQQDAAKQAPKDLAVKAKSLAIGGLQQKLSQIDPQKNPAEYHDVVAQIQDQVHGMREILNPDQKLGASDWLKAHTTDWLHITNHDKRVKQIAAQNAAGVAGDESAALSISQGSQPPVNPFVEKYNQLGEIPGLTPEQRLRAAVPGMTPKVDYKNIVGPNGEKAAIDLNSTQIPPGWTLAGTTSENSDTRARADFQADTSKPEGETFPAWLARKKAEGGTAGRGLSGIPGQLVELQTKKQLADSGQGPNLTPQEEAKLTNLEGYQEAQRRFQASLVQQRESGYAMARQMAPLSVLDSANGDQPTYTTYLEMKKDPGRFMPSGPGAKAMAQENLMEDLQGTSANVRKAIGALKQDFPASMKVKIATAMKMDDPSILGALISSGALGSLTDDQQDFLVGVQQLKENALAMRSVLGAGQGSDDVRRAIQSTLPSLLSPDRKFALKQLDAYDATVQRLHRGVPKVELNNTGQPGTAGTPPPGAKVIKWEDVK
jgi:hypothetical protein